MKVSPTKIISLRLPEPIYKRLSSIAAVTHTKSVNAWIIQTIKAAIAQYERELIDKGFEGMGDDPIYAALNDILAKDFAHSDSEAWRER